MNEEQVKSAVRWAVTTFGTFIAGWFAAKGWFTVDQVLSVLNSPTVIGLIASLVMGGWGLVVHKQSNAVAVVAAMAEDKTSPVKAVVVEDTLAGNKLADTVNSPKIVAAGTNAATNAAKG